MIIENQSMPPGVENGLSYFMKMILNHQRKIEKIFAKKYWLKMVE